MGREEKALRAVLHKRGRPFKPSATRALLNAKNWPKGVV